MERFYSKVLKTIYNQTPRFLIEELEEPNPNHFSITLNKSTFSKNKIYNITVQHTWGGPILIIYLNGYPQITQKFKNEEEIINFLKQNKYL